MRTHYYRARALRRALVASSLVPFVAVALTLAQASGLQSPEQRPIGFLLLLMAALPCAVYLSSAATGHPIGDLERGWGFLPIWQRGLSAMVALVCGLTAGVAFVLIVLALAALDANAAKPSQAAQNAKTSFAPPQLR